MFYIAVWLFCYSTSGFPVLASGTMQESFSAKECLAILKEFETWHHGLCFDADLAQSASPSQVIGVSNISFSPDGKFSRVKADSFDYQTGKKQKLQRSFKFGNGRNGWIAAGVEDTNSKDPTPNVATVVFAASDVNAASVVLSNDPPMGTICSMSLSQYFSQCNTFPVRKTIDNVTYTGFRCDHPKLASCEFLFDDDHLLRFVEQTYRAGDEIARVDKYEPISTCPQGQSSTQRWGPINYSTFDNHRVVSEFNVFRSDNQPAGFRSSAIQKHRDYDHVSTINKRLEFEEIPWLTDGFPIHCIHNKNIECMVRNGDVVIVVDKSSVDAARAARMAARSGSKTLFRNSFLRTLALTVFVFLIWNRNRNEP